MSEFGSIRVIILVYTGRTDLKQIVSSQNNKMILFYFHGSVKNFCQYRECLQCSRSNNIKKQNQIVKVVLVIM